MLTMLAGQVQRLFAVVKTSASNDNLQTERLIH